MKKWLLVLLFLLVLCDFFLELSEISDKEIAIRVLDDSKTVFTYNGNNYREEKSAPGTYFEKSVIENRKIYVSDSYSLWDRMNAIECSLYLEDPNIYFVFGEVHTFSECIYVREDFVYPTLSKNDIKKIFISNDFTQTSTGSFYETTDMNEIDEIVSWILKCENGDMLPDNLKNSLALSDQYYLYADYLDLPLIQVVGSIKMDSNNNLTFYKLKNVC